MNTLKPFTRGLLCLSAHECYNRLVHITAVQMLKMATEAEMLCYLERMNRCDSPKRRMRAVRNGYHKTRPVKICGKDVFIRVPRARNRCVNDEPFSSRIVHRYVRRDLSFDETIPLAYLEGVAGGSLNTPLEMLLKQSQAGLSPVSAGVLAEKWNNLHVQWKRRDLSRKQYACLWIETVRSTAARKNGRTVLAAAIGADRWNDAELLDVCYYSPLEPYQCPGVLRSLVSRGLKEPDVVVAGAIHGIEAEVKQCFKNTRLIALCRREG